MNRAVFAASDLDLQFVTDRNLCAGRGVVETAILAAAGGAKLVQLRDPLAKGRRLLDEALALKAALAGTPARLIINDRPDIALAAGAAGIHVGQDDLPVEAARALVGPDVIIGLTISTLEDLAGVPWDLIDYIGVGPVFSPGVKQNAKPVIGLPGLSAVARQARVPVIAIGGVAIGNVASCLDAGAQGVAVVSAIAAAADPQAATRAIAAEMALLRHGRP